MNKKLLICIVVGVMVIVVVILAWVLLRPAKVNNPPPASQATSYNLTVTDYNGSVSGSVVINANQTSLTESQIVSYADGSCNTPRDLRWVGCPTGYSLSNPTSVTGNKITSDPILKSTNIELKNGVQNSITITCSK